MALINLNSDINIGIGLYTISIITYMNLLKYSDNSSRHIVIGNETETGKLKKNNKKHDNNCTNIAINNTINITTNNNNVEHQSAYMQLIGNTPLIELKSISKLTNCRILAKVESANPGGSGKSINLSLCK